MIPSKNLDALKEGDLKDVLLVRSLATFEKLNSSTVMDTEVLDEARKPHRQNRYISAILKNQDDPFYPLLKEFADVVSKDPTSVLPPDRGARHINDLEPGTKYCTTRQWPLHIEKVNAINAFFAAKHAAGMVRVSKLPHSSPAFCVRKPNVCFQQGECGDYSSFNPDPSQGRVAEQHGGVQYF